MVYHIKFTVTLKQLLTSLLAGVADFLETFFIGADYLFFVFSFGVGYTLELLGSLLRPSQTCVQK